MSRMSLPISVYRRLPRRKPLSIGFSRYSLSFDGVDDHVQSSSDVFKFTDEFTVEEWVKLTGSHPNHHEPILGLLNSTGGHGISIHAVADHTNRFAYWDANNLWKNSTLTLTREVWYHLAVVVKSGSYVKFYANGSFLNEEALADVFPSLNGVLRIGWAWLDQATQGIIDEPHVYNRALSLEEINYNMLNYHNPIRDRLVLWLPFEEGTGLTAYDKSGYGNHGSLLPAADPPIWTRVKQWELRAEVGL